jgi:protease IV
MSILRVALIASLVGIQAHALSDSISIGLIELKGRIVSSEGIVKKLKQVADDPAIAAVLLRVNSGGGSVGPSIAIAQALEACKRKKPVVALVHELCASGAYWIAAHAPIIATPLSLIGSIGVLRRLERRRNLVIKLENGLVIPLDLTSFYKGKSLVIFNPLRSDLLEAEHIGDINEHTEGVYQEFKQAIIKQRPQITQGTAEEWAEGRIFSGRKAFELGLVDILGSYSEAEALIIRLLSPHGEAIDRKQLKLRHI